jgi:hypothetical protein
MTLTFVARQADFELDNMVYAVHGLTHEEIAIVEGLV